MFGAVLLVFGVAVAKTGTRVIDFNPDAGFHVYESPSLFHLFWVPISYDVIQTPDYSFKLLAFGTFLATTGFWIIVNEVTQLSCSL